MDPLIAFSAVVMTTFLTVLCGSFWYSVKGFGPYWGNSFYGGLTRFEAARIQMQNNLQTLMFITSFSHFMYNVLLLFMINNIYMPKTVGDLMTLTAVITAIYLLLEVPHVGFENRSYVALFIHTVYHYLITLVPLFIYTTFFSLPTAELKL